MAKTVAQYGLKSMVTADIKFFGGNKSAGTRARKSAQELKKLLDTLRKEILSERKGEE